MSKLNFITRDEWGAQPPKIRRPLKLPVGYVAEDHWCPLTINKWKYHETCTTKEECMQRVRDIQEMAFKKEQDDLVYNFLIGGDGNVYEGRGWTVLLPDDWIWDGILCGYIGKFTKQKPVPEHMKQVFRDLVAYGKERLYIRPRAYVFALDQEDEFAGFEDQ